VVRRTFVLLTFLSFVPTDLVRHDAHMIIANLGDCRAVLCRGGKAVRLSEDHKPSRPGVFSPFCPRLREEGARQFVVDDSSGRASPEWRLTRGFASSFAHPFQMRRKGLKMLADES
jgi:hypothetical protein